MKRRQLDALSDNLNKATNPTIRKQEATTKILEQFEPLPILSNSAQAPAFSPDPAVSGVKDTGVNPTPVSVDTVSKLIPVSKSQGCEQHKKIGYLKVPNEIVDQVLTRLEPSEAVVFLRLYRLSVGFNQSTCTVGMTALVRACNVSESTCRRALRTLIDLKLIRQLEVLNTKEVKGTTYQIDTGVNLRPVSNPHRCPSETGVQLTPNKDDSDDLIHNNHHHSAVDDDSPHFQEVKAAYCQITGNPWLPSDTESYTENAIDRIAANKAIATMQAVKLRSGTRINSFNYFVREILNASDPRNRQFQKRSLARIVRRIRENHVGAHNYGIADLVYDVKEGCAREGVVFDNDFFNSFNS